MNKDREGKTGHGIYIKLAAGVLLFAAAFFACGFLFGRVLPGNDSTLAAVREAEELVRSDFYYYGEETEQQLIAGALKGMAAYLDDDYAYYYTAEEYAALLEDNSGNYVGIGITIGTDTDGGIIIYSTVENGPAAGAGLLAGDRITAVNGSGIEGLTVEEAAAFVKGEEGAENTITVLRGTEELTFTVIAASVYTPYVHYRMLSDGIGYIYISSFHGEAAKETETAVEELKEQGMRALVLDVRDDPGGELTAVCKIADIFLPEDSVITTLRARNGKEKVYKTEKAGLGLPVAMLVNGDSASASELLAGALKDNGAAVLFGTKTYGKGIVQSYYELKNGKAGAFRITTEAYYTPSGVCIQGEGITPDYTVELPETLTYYYIYDLSSEEDTQLRAAVEYLKGLN